MIDIPPNFPSYTSYSPKMLIQHVDQLKAAIRELQEKISKLEAQATAAPAPKKKETMNG
jgi:phage shock protein A